MNNFARVYGCSCIKLELEMRAADFIYGYVKGIEVDVLSSYWGILTRAVSVYFD